MTTTIIIIIITTNISDLQLLFIDIIVVTACYYEYCDYYCYCHY